MKAAYINTFGPPSVIQTSDTWPLPTRKPGECLVRIHAASINPVDSKNRTGTVPRFLLAKDKILGGDMAGIVEEADHTSRFQRGDKVYALSDGWAAWVKAGTFAGYISISEKLLARMPSALSFEQAASLPLVAITAYQALKPAKIQPGQRVLIHAGSGGVGSVAIQLAKHWGAYVVTTASASNEKLLKDLGADEVLDYRAERFEQKYRDAPFDAALDVIGGDYERRSLAVVKRRGAFVHVMNQGWNKKHGNLVGMMYEIGAVFRGKLRAALRLGPRYIMAIGVPGGEDLEALTKLVEEGRLRAVVDRVYPLEDVRAAHEYLEQGHVRGKVVLRIA